VAFHFLHAPILALDDDKVAMPGLERNVKSDGGAEAGSILALARSAAFRPLQLLKGLGDDF